MAFWQILSGHTTSDGLSSHQCWILHHADRYRPDRLYALLYAKGTDRLYALPNAKGTDKLHANAKISAKQQMTTVKWTDSLSGAFHALPTFTPG